LAKLVEICIILTKSSPRTIKKTTKKRDRKPTGTPPETHRKRPELPTSPHFAREAKYN